MDNLNWFERIRGIIEQEKNDKTELDKFEDWLKSELEKTTTPCAFLKDLLAKIWLESQISEYYKRELSKIIEHYLSKNNCF